MSLINNIAALAQLGVDSIIVKPKRLIGPFVADVTIREKHHDGLQLTNHPVEFGSTISDHAFMLPSELILTVGWSNSPRATGLDGLTAAITGTATAVQSLLTGNAPQQVKDVYTKMLQLQAQRIPIDVFTGKRIYRNMMIIGLDTETTGQTENSLLLNIELREVIMVSTSVVSVPAPASAQANPASTLAVSNLGAKSLQPGAAWRNGIQTLKDNLEIPQ